uniref:Uncharacterized protein TCIL3000_5_180 n=1 Tax=Trypanosoma congolense (strain IL3000) TaxID=1068625 RepID=G0UMC4_TRYCI|nr:unnamed protein product [Trypanosoma congolense IL3000]
MVEGELQEQAPSFSRSDFMHSFITITIIIIITVISFTALFIHTGACVFLGVFPPFLFPAGRPHLSLPLSVFFLRVFIHPLRVTTFYCVSNDNDSHNSNNNYYWHYFSSSSSSSFPFFVAWDHILCACGGEAAHIIRNRSNRRGVGKRVILISPLPTNQPTSLLPLHTHTRDAVATEVIQIVVPLPPQFAPWWGKQRDTPGRSYFHPRLKERASGGW